MLRTTPQWTTSFSAFFLTINFFLTQTVYSEQASRVGAIKAEDTTKMQRRVEARNYSYFGIGPGHVAELGNDSLAYSLRFGHLWEVNPWAAVKAGIDATVATENDLAGMATGGIGANFYFTDSDFSPFVGIDFGLGGVFSDVKGVDDDFGFMGGLEGGLALFRTSSVQLHLTYRYAVMMKENPEGKRPGESTLSLNLFY